MLRKIFGALDEDERALLDKLLGTIDASVAAASTAAKPSDQK